MLIVDVLCVGNCVEYLIKHEAQFYKREETKHEGPLGPTPLPGARKATEGSELFDPKRLHPGVGAVVRGKERRAQERFSSHFFGPSFPNLHQETGCLRGHPPPLPRLSAVWTTPYRTHQY